MMRNVRVRPAPVALATFLAPWVMALLLGGGCSSESASPGIVPLADASLGDGEAQAEGSVPDGPVPGDALAPTCLDATPGGYAGVAMPSQTGAFELVFDVTPQGELVEAGLGLSGSAQSSLDWSDLAAIVRFNPAGSIDVRNGGGYEAQASVHYASASTYRVREVVDVAKHVYSVFVTPPGGDEVAVGEDFAFRTEQQAVPTLQQWGIRSDTGALRVCLVSLTPQATEIQVVVTPDSPKVLVGATQQFNAAVTGTTNTAVTWKVDEATGCGSVTSSGLYTAPAAPNTCHVTATSEADSSRADTVPVAVVSSVAGDYPFQGYTKTRGAFEALVDGAAEPRVLIVDRLSPDSSSGELASGRGSLPWALKQTFPRVILFEISGVIDVGGSLSVTSPYVSVHGQTAPSPGITLYNVELMVATHDVILQHLRVRMGANELGGGDSLTMCGKAGGGVHDVIIDHCSAALSHDEQLSISACGKSDVLRVTLSNNLIALGLTTQHAFGTLIDSGGNNDFSVDEILLDGNLFSNVMLRTPLINPAARRVTVTNNITYNTLWRGLQVESQDYPEGQFIDFMNNLYWRGPETSTPGMWPADEAATWPAEPDLWPWDPNRRVVSAFFGPKTTRTHVYFEGNYHYVNNKDYTYGNHEGRPVRLKEQLFQGGISATDIEAASRQTNVAVKLMTPIQLEKHAELEVGATPHARDALDALAVSDALNRTGGYLGTLSNLKVPAVPAGSGTRALNSIVGYPSGHELGDVDGDGLTDLEEWIYGL